MPPARALYETLLEPVEAWLPEEAELIIVPDDFLFYLPFEVLVVESRDAEHRYDFSAATFLVERYAISYSASASVLDPTLKRPREFTKGVLAFGNPSFPDTMEQPRLPNSEAEVEAIEAAFEGYENNVLTGDAATEPSNTGFFISPPIFGTMTGSRSIRALRFPTASSKPTRSSTRS